MPGFLTRKGRVRNDIIGKATGQFISGLMAASLAVAASGCGTEFIGDMKSFEHNESPVITSFTSSVDPLVTEIYPGMDMLLTVEAHDIEGDPITYSFESDQGTMRDLKYTADGCTIEYFIKSTCTSSESIPVTVIAEDDKGASSSQTINLGDRKTGPTITLESWSFDTDPLTPTQAQAATVSFHANATGYFQVRIQTPPADLIEFNNKKFFNIRANATETKIIYVAADSEEAPSLTEVGSHKIYVLVIDEFGRQSTISQTMTVAE